MIKICWIDRKVSNIGGYNGEGTEFQIIKDAIPLIHKHMKAHHSFDIYINKKLYAVSDGYELWTAGKTRKQIKI